MKTLRVASALLLAGVVISGSMTAATAADPTTFTVHVQDTDGRPLEGIWVTASGPRSVEFGLTDDNGDITRSRGIEGSSRLTRGTYTVSFNDWNDDRLSSSSTYVGFSEDVTIAVAQDNNPGPVTLEPGGRVTGTVTAPSGRPVQNMLVNLWSDEDEDAGGSADTTRTGGFDVFGLAVTSYTVDLYLGPEDDVAELRRPVRIDEPGQSVRYDIPNFRLRCSTKFELTSTKRGQVQVAVRSTGKLNGITKPGGAFRLLRGKKSIASFAWKNAGWSRTLTGQPRGKKVTYTAVYTGGDCRNWSSVKSVKVKK